MDLRALRIYVVAAWTAALIFNQPAAGQEQTAAVEDQAGSRDVRLVNSDGARLTINQIETSAFPKVQIFASVTRGDQPVIGLTDADFKIREDEVPQEPIKVEAQVVPLSVVMTIDTSGSMTKAMPDAREAAKAFVDTLEAQDSAGVISFNRTITPILPIGSARDAAKRAIDSLQARGDTALFDALHASLEAAKGRTGRRAVVLLSDGVDDDGQGRVLSKHTLEEVLALAREVNVPVFTIGLGSEIDEQTLRRVAAESGGYYFNAPTIDELKELYGKLGRQLSGQYQLNYTSNLPADGSVHNIQLLHGSTRSTKSYVSPKGQAVAQTAPVAAAAPVSQPPKPVVTGEITGSDAPENAPLIPLGQKVTIVAPMRGEVVSPKFFVAVDLDSAVLAQASGFVTKVPNETYAYMYFVTPNMAEINSDKHWTSSRTGTLTPAVFTRRENQGRWLVAFRGIAKADLGVYPTKLADAGTNEDAGESEATSLPLSLGSTISGTIEAGWDDIDGYKAEVKGGEEYSARVRPELTGHVKVQVYNDEGLEIAEAESKNAGAGVTLTWKQENDGIVLIAVKKGYNLNRQCTYSLAFGNKGVAAPPQPQAASIKKPL